jgi:hypothetical protein
MPSQLILLPCELIHEDMSPYQTVKNHVETHQILLNLLFLISVN